MKDTELFTADTMRTFDACGRWSAITHCILQEREYQDNLYGTIQESPHTPAGWLLLIRKELEEAETALIKGGEGRNAWRQELIQVAALCAAALEQHGLVPAHDNVREI